MRAAVVAALALVLAPAAGATPRALGPADRVARSGDAAILARADDGVLTVTRAPLDGRPAVNLLSAKVANAQIVHVAASAERAAVLVSTKAGLVVYAGAATGPIARIGSMDPNEVQAAGDTVFIGGQTGGFEAIARDGNRMPVDLPKTAASVTFAGDYVAYTETLGDEPEDEPSLHVRLADWRTSETIKAIDLERGVVNLDLREDGTLIIDSDGRGLQTLGPDQDLETLGDAPEGNESIGWAGDSLVFSVIDRFGRYRTPLVRSPDGATRRFGLGSITIDDLSADATTALWHVDGCAITAPLTDDLGARYTGNGCRLSEAITQPPYTKTLHRKVRIAVECLVSTSDDCVGTIRAPELRRTVKVRIPIGTTEKVRVALRAAALRKLRKADGGVLHLRIGLKGGRATQDLYPVG